MTDHPHQLYAIEFTEADQARLVGFSCGDEPWSRHVTEWLLGSDVLDSMRRMTVNELRAKYVEVFGETTNARHKEWLIRRIAWRMQALAGWC